MARDVCETPVELSEVRDVLDGLVLPCPDEGMEVWEGVLVSGITSGVLCKDKMLVGC